MSAFRRQILLPTALLLCGLLTAPAGAGAATPANVQSLVKRVGGASGAYVYDVTSNQLVAAKNAGARRILASNTKLFTAAATLDKYGEDGQFTTALWSDGTLAGGVLTGDVYLRGGGDPLFGSTDYVKKYFGSGATVQQLATNLRSAGVTQITGRVYGDETAFDGRRGTAPYGFGRSWEIGGQLSGLVYNKGINGSHFQENPPLFAAQKMRLALKAANVTVTGGNGVKTTPVTAQRMTLVQSLPITTLVRQMDKPSNNYLAEMLLKGLGMPKTDDANGGAAPVSAGSVTTRGGAAVARKFAAGVGSRVSLTDGSGLSRSDKAAPREVVDLLRAMSRKQSFDSFQNSLPIPGVDGTLANRMKGTRASKACHAKTGTLSNVSSLSGICTTAGGHLIAFSILQNKVNPSIAHGIQDKIVTTVAQLP